MRTRLIPVIHGTVTFTAKLLFGLRATGRHHIPKSGPVILAGNHISDWDPPVLGMASSRVPYYMAKSELFKGSFTCRLLEKLGAFPVNRTGIDTEAIRTALGLLQQGEALAMFPEGTRSRTGLLGQAKNGIALIARKSTAPLVPFYISGTRNPLKSLFRRGGFRVAFGPPITPAELSEAYGRGGSGGLSSMVMERIADVGRDSGVFVGFEDSGKENL